CGVSPFGAGNICPWPRRVSGHARRLHDVFALFLMPYPRRCQPPTQREGLLRLAADPLTSRGEHYETCQGGPLVAMEHIKEVRICDPKCRSLSISRALKLVARRW